ncbi:MAG: nitrilase-related carbon-nitrogen hydrolase [Alphaproteobacteria bacterium]
MDTIDLYTAVVVQSEPHVVYKRKDLEINLGRALEILDSTLYSAPNAKAPAMLVNYEPYAPIKLVAFPEDFLQGFTMKADRRTHVEEIAIKIPGPETDRLAKRARELKIYLYGCALEVLPQWPETIFNCAFIIGPTGEIIHKFHKFSPAIHYELSTSPWEVLDEYLEVFGKGKTMLETFFPVTETEIGKLGTIICNDGYHPEYFRAVAMNGAEVIIRPALAEPGVTRGWFEITNRAGALSTLCYVVAPNMGGVVGPEAVRHIQAGDSMIVDYDGQLIGRFPYPGEGIASATIRLDHLRQRRTDPSRNFPTLLKAEVLREIYAQPIYPPNRFREDAVTTFRDLYKKDTRQLGVIDEFMRRGIYTPPRNWKKN